MTDDTTVGLRASPLAAEHAAAGATMAPFAGWSMPLRFDGTIAEHEAVRQHVGAFDVSHLGTVWVDGADAERVVAATFTNDPSRLVDGGSQYTLCCDDRGGIVDDLIVYRLEADRWLAVPNAANTAEVVAALEAALAGSGGPGDDSAGPRDARIRDESGAWAILAIQGPDALALADGVVGELGSSLAISQIEHLGVAEVALDGHTALACRTGYTGESGCELVVPVAVAPAVWAHARQAGAAACGLGARDTLRLEMGYPLHGNELSLETNPYEARLGWAVKLDRAGFRGRSALQAVKDAGVRRKLWGLRSDGRRPLRSGLAVLRPGDPGQPAGTTTSGGLSPTLGVGIGLAYLDSDVEVGSRVDVDVRGNAVSCEVVRPPFVDRRPGG